MMIVKTDTELRAHIRAVKSTGASVAFVPTMGNLHDGHLDLVRRGMALADHVVVSIFVNPMQFGADEDLDSYPRTLNDDIEKLKSIGAHVLYTPDVSQIYPEGLNAHTRVCVPGLTNVLCGASRPGHFDGVTTVVCKLFQLVAPDVAVFGEKDLQQLLIIRKMVRDLALPLTIEGVPTKRAADGLALSSRNRYLDSTQRSLAPLLQQKLQGMAAAIVAGDRNFEELTSRAFAELREQGFSPDYIDTRRRSDLQPAGDNDSEIAIFAAARLGDTRLIDNVELNLNDPVSR